MQKFLEISKSAIRIFKIFIFGNGTDIEFQICFQIQISSSPVSHPEFVKSGLNVVSSITVINITEIGQLTAELWPINDFQYGGCPPS